MLVPDLGQVDGVEGSDVQQDPPNIDLSGPLGAKEERVKTRDAMEFYYDMKLAGTPLQCSDDDGTCMDMWWASRPYDEKLC